VFIMLRDENLRSSFLLFPMISFSEK